MLKSLSLSPHPGSASHPSMACLSIDLFIIHKVHIEQSMCAGCEGKHLHQWTLKPTTKAEVSPIHLTSHQSLQ